MTTFKSNRSGNDIVVDIDVEKDQDVFLSMAGSKPSGHEIFEYIITDPDEVEYFFQTVAEAKEKWEKYQAKGG